MNQTSDNHPSLSERNASKHGFNGLRVLIIVSIAGCLLFWLSRSSYRDLAPGVYLLHDEDSTYRILVDSSYDLTPGAPHLQGGAVSVKNVRSIARKQNVCIYGMADKSSNADSYFLLELWKKNQDVDAEFFPTADVLQDQLRRRFGIQSLHTTPAKDY